MGLWTVVTTAAYLRPGEAMALEPLNFVAPTPPAVPLWSILVRPSELEVPSKTFEYDDTVIWDHAHLQWMVTFFEKWHATPVKGPIWSFTYTELAKEFKSVSTELGLVDLVPYALRHTGASMDALNGWRPLSTIQKRGR